MKHNRVIISAIGVAGLAVLIAMLNLTSPTELGPVGVLLFLTTLYVVMFCAVSLVMQTFYRIALKKTVFVSKDYLYSAILAFGPIMLLMARSFGAINLWTISLIVLFLALAEFLVHKKI